MKTTKQITGQILTIRKRAKAQRDGVQETACDIIEHFTEHSDARLATRLVEALGQGIQSEKLVNFFEAFGGMSWKSKERKFIKSTTKKINLDAAKAQMWYLMEGTADVMSDEEKLNKRLLSAIKIMTENTEALEALGYVLNFKQLEEVNNAA